MVYNTKCFVLLAVVLYVHSSSCLSVYQDDPYEGHHDHHHGLPPATSYATISTTHIKVQHPPAASTNYATPYKYEYVQQPQMAYKYVSLPSILSLQPQVPAVKYEQQPSTPGYKYLAASPVYKYVQPPTVTTEPEAAEEPTNSLKYALKYEQNTFKQEQLRQDDYEQPAVQYKYVAVPSYKYVQVQHVAAAATADPEYGGQHRLQATYDYADEKQ